MIAPIAKVTVRESGAGHYAPDDVTVSLYAPGLPPGEHDLYPETWDWRPIETAPAGGKWVLVWWPTITDCALPAYRNADDGWHCPVGSYDGYVEGEQFGKPTHWMPLPEAPTP